MRQSGFRAWKVFGGLASAALLSIGCGKLPDTGGQRPDDPPESFLETWQREDITRYQYKVGRSSQGTIRDVGSSIDPRTAENEGQRNNSRRVDVTGRPAPSTHQSGIGGSGRAGESESSSDLGWRARRGYDVGPVLDFGPYGHGATE